MDDAAKSNVSMLRLLLWSLLLKGIDIACLLNLTIILLLYLIDSFFARRKLLKRGKLEIIFYLDIDLLFYFHSCLRAQVKIQTTSKIKRKYFLFALLYITYKSLSCRLCKNYHTCLSNFPSVHVSNY